MRCACGNTNLIHSEVGWFCYPCQEIIAPSTDIEVVPSRAVVSSSPKASSEPFQNEKELVRAIKRELERRGWTVLEVGQYVASGSGTTIATPDLSVSHPTIKPFSRWIEVKFGSNKPTEKQQKLIDAGISVAVWSVEEALKAVGERV